VSSRRRLGWLTLGVGLGLLLLIGRREVGQPPLYDGVIVEDPYRYLQPAGGQPGNPTSGAETVPLDAGDSPALLAATQENPPQAELVVDRGSVALAPGTTAVKVSIQPIPPPEPAGSSPDARIRLSGNVYQFVLTNQAGVAMKLQPGTNATVVLRAPNGVTNGVIARYADNRWSPLKTDNGGLPDLYSTNATDLGIFAVTLTGTAASQNPASSPATSERAIPSPTPSEGFGAPIWIAIGLLAVALLLGIWYLRDVARGPAPPSRR
jgi:hypothetical protein